MVQSSINDVRLEDYTGRVKEALEFLQKNYSQLIQQEVGKYEVSDNFFYMIQEYDAKESTKWEAHNKYIDIQLVLKGEEIIEVAHRKYLSALGTYNPEKDFIGFDGEATTFCTLQEGDFAILFPEDAHKPGLRTASYAGKVNKCVVKVLV